MLEVLDSHAHLLQMMGQACRLRTFPGRAEHEAEPLSRQASEVDPASEVDSDIYM